MKLIITVIVTGLMVAGAMGATHYAWGNPIPWDQVTGSATQKAALAAPPADFTLAPSPAGLGEEIQFRVYGKNRPAMQLSIYTIDGQKVRSLRLSSSGLASWNQRDARGQAVPTGMYLARLKAGKQTVERKVMIVK